MQFNPNLSDIVWHKITDIKQNFAFLIARIFLLQKFSKKFDTSVVKTSKVKNKKYSFSQS